MSPRWLLALALISCGTPDRDPPAPEPARSHVTPTPPADASFGLYVLALSWAPSFCCGHPDKEECSGLASAFAGNHLTLHGLWPNYTDDEARGHATYPQFCGSYAHCANRHDASCEPDPATIPAEMRDLGPGYVGDHDFLANHEWPKHGSCTGLDPASYFKAALGAMQQLPGQGTPDALHGAIGHDLALADLQHAFGVPDTSVLLSCDASCRLSQVSICLAHDAKGLPTTPLACPANTTNARYDNGCVTRNCARVIVAAANSCARGEDDTGDRPHRRRTEPRGPGGHACNHPGQGPSCTSDGQCVQDGFVRCARSGCCTSQP